MEQPWNPRWRQLFLLTSTSFSWDPVIRDRLIRCYFHRLFFHFSPFSFSTAGGVRLDRSDETLMVRPFLRILTVPLLYLVLFIRRDSAASARADCMSAIQNCFAEVVPWSSVVRFSSVRRYRCCGGNSIGDSWRSDLTCSSTMVCSATVFPSDGL